MADEAALDFCRTEAIAADQKHVVNAADDPDVAVLIFAGAIAGEVPALLGEFAPVLVDVALRVAIDGAQHARPR